MENVMLPESHRMVDVLCKVMNDADFVIIDSAAGLGKEAVSSIKAADEMIIITNPDMPALTDALKLSQMAKRFETHNTGVVVNRIRNESHELSPDEIENFLNAPLLGTVHEDHRVRKAISEKRPVVTHSPKSLSSQQFKAIAARLIGEEYKVRKPALYRMWGWLRK